MKLMEGQRVLVLGGTSGIGLATAEMATDAGATVAITGREAGNLERCVGALTERGGVDVTGTRVAIEDRSAVQDWVRDHAPVDHLVMPGSTVIPLAYGDLTAENARSAFESKFWGPFWALFDARPHLRRGGSVVLFSGVAAERPVKGYVVGAAINGAINALTRSLALEFGGIGVRVNAVAPGAVLTPLWTRLHGADGAAELAASYATRLPVGRVGTADEGGSAVMFLMSNGFVNGHVVRLDGGALAMA